MGEDEMQVMEALLSLVSLQAVALTKAINCSEWPDDSNSGGGPLTIL